MRELFLFSFAESALNKLFKTDALHFSRCLNLSVKLTSLDFEMAQD